LNKENYSDGIRLTGNIYDEKLNPALATHDSFWWGTSARKFKTFDTGLCCSCDRSWKSQDIQEKNI
jgi:hypothetical protein